MNRLPNLTAALLVALLFAPAGCNSDHYLIANRVQIEEVEVEVPIYIEVEVPTDPENSEVWVDSFNQPTSVDGVDILWVIDTSGSMHHLQDELLDMFYDDEFGYKPEWARTDANQWSDGMEGLLSRMFFVE